MLKKIIFTFRAFFLLLIIILLIEYVPAAKPLQIRGIYLNSWIMRSDKNFPQTIGKAKKHGINSLVCDYQGEKNKKEYIRNLRLAQKKGFYLIARIVVFKDGARQEMINNSHAWPLKIQLAKKAEKLGFNEIQFDYIRFKDQGAPNISKKQYIEKFLTEATEKINIPIQIDVFGSVAHHPRLIIGQDLNSLANIVSAVCPMLYPSHFFLDKMRMSKPYFTMKEGCLLAKKQIGYRPMRLIPYIQGFDLNIGYAGLTLPDYIIAQLRAVEDTHANGFIIWNAGSDYSATWTALKKYPLI